MELRSMATASLSLVVLLLLVEIKKRAKNGGGEVKLPPGPRPLPIIGSMHLLAFKVPHHFFWELAKEYGPLVHLRVGEISFVVASSAEAASEMLKTHDLAFSDRPQINAMHKYSYDGRDLAMAPYGDHWRSLRKVCVLEVFSMKRVVSFRPIREDEASRFVTSIRAASPAGVDLSNMLHNLSNNIIMRAIMGDHCKHKEDVLSLAKETVDALAGLGIADLFPSSAVLRWFSNISMNHKNARGKMERILNRIIQDRRDQEIKPEEEEEDQDLLGVLLRLLDQGELSTDSLKGVILDIFVGGSETTSTIVEWAMSELIRNPEAMERAQREVRREIGGGGQDRLTESHLQGKLNYVRLVMKEALRMHPPGPFLPRQCRYPCRVLGYDVPKDARVLVNAWAIGRDPRHWDNPDEFRPERFLDAAAKDYKGADYEFLPFGAGRRMCPGMAFGVASLEIILAHLLYYFDWKLPAGAGPDDLDMTETVGGTSRRKVPLVLCPIPVPVPVY